MSNSYFKKFNSAGIPFMENRTLGDIKTLVDAGVFHIMGDYGFIKSKQNSGDYAAFCVKENNKEFYFGGSAVTSVLHDIDADNMRDELEQQPCTFVEFESKFGNKGVAVRFAE